MALLDGLDNVDWRKASHTRGLATDMPELLRGLVDPDPSVRSTANAKLADRLEHQFTVWSASSLTVPFLAEILMDGPRHRGLRLAVLARLSSVVGGELEAFADVRMPFDPAKFDADAEDPGTWRDEDRCTAHEDEELLGQMTRVWAKASYDAVEAAIPALIFLLEDPDDDLAMEFIALLRIFPRCADCVVPALQRLDVPEFSDERREAAREMLALLPSVTKIGS